MAFRQQHLHLSFWHDLIIVLCLPYTNRTALCKRDLLCLEIWVKVIQRCAKRVAGYTVITIVLLCLQRHVIIFVWPQVLIHPLRTLLNSMIITIPTSGSSKMNWKHPCVAIAYASYQIAKVLRDNIYSTNSIQPHSSKTKKDSDTTFQLSETNDLDSYSLKHIHTF